MLFGNFAILLAFQAFIRTLFGVYLGSSKGIFGQALAAGSYLDPAASSDNANDNCATCELLVGGACRGGGNLTAPKLATLPGYWRAQPNATAWLGLADNARVLYVIGHGGDILLKGGLMIGAIGKS